MKESVKICPGCNRELSEKELEENLDICPYCHHYFRMDWEKRLTLICDDGSYKEFAEDMKATNLLGVPGYDKKLQENKEKARQNDAVSTGTCTIDGKKVILCVMSFDFMGGSMGATVGEKITAAMIKAALEDLPLIICTASGGARMQEGIFSLMQMAKTSAAAALMGEVAVPLFILLTSPTMGGVTASFAMLGDVILAEPQALIGFAGSRVIQGTIREKLPKGFQTSEFQQSHGFLDAIVERKDLHRTLSFLLRTHEAT
ncbi:MAG: acetyl-CoA carboxylase, carboxyltransferase subunit beta [Spirochaetia bacterium]|jgi:acetyl-CoA carboxylase carboxyl transferase subunit beta|nr:acetyl-CoA carboxylase, carboxyltransferase subunit beta [Spirochaetia bacterium]